MKLTVDLDWQGQKAIHKSLSAFAAREYDSHYAHACYATEAYMGYEEELINTYALLAPDHSLALDLGSGTGRTTLCLGAHFREVFGMDFAGEMVKVARDKALAQQARGCHFMQADVEDGLAWFEDDSCGMVNSAFGMGSFVENPMQMMAEVQRILLPGGLAIFSFYNADPLTEKLSMSWTPALSARINKTASQLTVNVQGTTFTIPARAYSVDQVADMLGAHFEIVQLTTFPALSALFPQEFFTSAEARALCQSVDRYLSFDLKIGGGPYIIGVCRKAA